MNSKFKGLIAGLAVFGLASANPAFGAGATRSAAALPLLAASVGSVPYAAEVERTWACTRVTDDPLKLKNDYVRTDAAGRVVLSAQNLPFTCKPPAGAYAAGHRFPFALLFGIVGAGGLIALLAGGGSNNDSNG